MLFGTDLNRNRVTWEPPAVKQFPPTKANRRTPLLRDPHANAGIKRTSMVEHNLYFARARDCGIN